MSDVDISPEAAKWAHDLRCRVVAYKTDIDIAQFIERQDTALTATQEKLAAAEKRKRDYFNDAQQWRDCAFETAAGIIEKYFPRGEWKYITDDIRALKSTTPAPVRDDALSKAVADARARYDAMTPEQKAAHDKAQKESFVRGMMPTGDPWFD